MANEIKITVGADTKKADQAMKGFRQRLDGVAKNARVAGVAFAAMGGAGVIAIKGFASAALEQQRAMDTLAVTMANAGESFEGMKDHIMSTTAALQSKTNYGDEAQLRVLAQLVPMLGNTNDALAALPAIMDVAAVTGKDFESTVMTMGPVLAGLTNTIRGTALAFDKSQGPMERIDVILNSLGGSAEAQANPFTQLSNAVGDLKEKMGDALLPVLRPVLGAFQSLAERLQTMNPNVLRIVAAVLAGVTAFALIAAPILLLIGLLPVLATGFALLTASALPILAVVAGIAIQVGLMIVIFKNWNRIVETVRKVWDRVSSKMSDIFRSKWAWLLPGGIFIKAILFIKDRWESIWGAVRDFFGLIVNEVERKMNFWVNMFIDAINGIIDAANFLGGWLGINIPKMNNVTISLGDTFNAVKDTVANVAGTIKKEVSGAMDSLFGDTEKGISGLEAFDDSVNQSIGSLTNLEKVMGEGMPNALGLFDEHLADAAAAMGGLGAEAEKAAAKQTTGTGGVGGGGGGRGGSVFHTPSSGFGIYEEVKDPVTGKIDREKSGWRGMAPMPDPGAGFVSQRNELQEIEAIENPTERALAFAAFMKRRRGKKLHPLISERAFPKLAEYTLGQHLDPTGPMPDIDPRILEFAGGGRVPGPVGSPRLAMVHGGEMILNRKQQQQAGIVVNITGNHITGEMELDRLVRRAITSAGVRGAF